jgi:hypothetical protein
MINKNEEDNIYYNISFEPLYDATGKYSLRPLRYSETKTQPILKNPNDFYMTIVNFSIPLNELPIIIPPIQANQPDPNRTTLVIGIRNGVNDYPENVQFRPQFSTQINSIPVQNKPTPVITPYYYIYSYAWMTGLINTALQTAFNASGLAGSAPYFTYDGQTELLSLIVSSTFIKTATNPNPPQIFFNRLFYQYLDGFTTYIETPYATNGFEAYFLLEDNYIKDINGYALYGTAPTVPPSFYKITQTSNAIAYWSCIKRIIFESNLVPVREEYTHNNTGYVATRSILADFIPVINKASDSRSIAYYTANGQYKLTDIITNADISSFSLSIYWEDVFGNINIIETGPTQNASVKLGFIRKTLFKNK